MKQITTRGKTAEEAIQTALLQLDVSKEDCDILIIDEGHKGFLGIFGNKQAVVELTVKNKAIEAGKHYLQEIIGELGIEMEIESSKKGRELKYDLSSQDIAKVIGKEGQTLNALETLTQIAVNQHAKTPYFVSLDAMGYRERRKESLQRLAQQMIEKAIDSNKKFAFEPMSASERKIIHKVLEKKHNILSRSEGSEPYRYIVIEKAKKKI